MKSSTPFLILVSATLSFAAGMALEHRQAQPTVLESRVFHVTDTKLSNGSWGSIRIYTPDGTETAGTSSMLTAQLEFMPGQRLQPPHRHPQEEFQYVISGHGTWHLNGQDIPLEPGDLMYSKPGDLHGIANTGSEPLRFLVVKWISRAGAAATP